MEITVAKIRSVVVMFALLRAFSQGPFVYGQTANISAAELAAPRDQAAVAVLESAVAAIGGKAAIKAFQDFSATGVMTYPSADSTVQGGAEIRAKSPDQVRIDVDLPDRKNSIIISHGKGSISDSFGTREISNQNARHMGLLIFVYPAIVQALDNLQTGISLSESTENVNGVEAYRIHIVQPTPPTLRGDSKLRQLRTLDVLIDRSTSMVMQLEHPLVADNRHHTIRMRQVNFSDFRNISGLLVPFAIEEKEANQHVSTLRLSTFKLNSGVSQTEFDQ
jgi:hypothetical protein